jgi:dihydrodipicolinate synthase/N-acetylneuraminate lyase
MSESERLPGVIPILVTPFDEDFRIDEESVRRLIRSNLEAGVHELRIAFGSEVFRLTEAERVERTRIVVDEVGGHVPVVVNTGADGTDLEVHYSRMAEENGADALIILPPTLMAVGRVEIVKPVLTAVSAFPLR